MAAEDDVINAISIADLDKYINDYDVFLIGPQMSFRLKEIKERVEALGKKTAAKIDIVAYGTGNGAKVYEQAKTLYKGLNSDI